MEMAKIKGRERGRGRDEVMYLLSISMADSHGECMDGGGSWNSVGLINTVYSRRAGVGFH